MSKNKFSEAVDPRFLGIFEPSNSERKSVAAEDASSSKQTFSSTNSSIVNPHLPYLSEKLFAYFDKNTKVVERPKPVADLSDLQICEIRLFENSQPIRGDEENFVEERPLKKKKKKHKSKEKELWKEVAVTPEWLSRQAKILNS